MTLFDELRALVTALDAAGVEYAGRRSMSVEMSAAAIEACLRAASDMAGSL